MASRQELVHAKVELAAAEQRRHEDIDAFKKKLQAVKDTVVAYAAASSSNSQVYRHPKLTQTAGCLCWLSRFLSAAATSLQIDLHFFMYFCIAASA